VPSPSDFVQHFGAGGPLGTGAQSTKARFDQGLAQLDALLDPSPENEMEANDFLAGVLGHRRRDPVGQDRVPRLPQRQVPRKRRTSPIPGRSSWSFALERLSHNA
jgi:hypothetical protein